MAEPTAEKVISIVSDMFEVSEIERNLMNIRFRVEGGDLKSEFIALSHRLYQLDLVAEMAREDGAVLITVSRMRSGKSRRFLSSPWMPRILFATVFTFVMTNGYYRTIDANSVINIGEPLEMAAVFTLALLGILGTHELGHMVVARYYRLKWTWPYFIPGFPIIGIPTFGAVIFQSKGMTINRGILFDVAIAGPVAGLVITIIVMLYGAYTAPVIPVELAAQLYESRMISTWDLGEPLLMTAALAAFGKGGDGTEVLMTPLLFAAWFGFLITFLNMLPAWQLDGGHMARTLLSEKWHRITTYASAAILVWPLDFWIMGLMILFLSSRNTGAHILDSVSPLPRSRMYAYAAIAVLAVLCAPIPGSLL